MRCEECLPLIEEYLDGELSGRTAERAQTHLATCAECARELETLRREQELYASYQRDLEVSPAAWNIIHARIEQEKDATTEERGAKPQGWLNRLFGAGSQFRPALIAALLLIAVGLTALIIYTNSRRGQNEVAVERQDQNQVRPTDKAQKGTTPDNANRGDVAIAKDNENGTPQERETVIDSNPGVKEREKRETLARLNRAQPEKRQPQKLTPQPQSPKFEEASAPESVAGGRAAVVAGDFDMEIARHAERAELLLRSFRNARSRVTDHALDVAYEREQSRKLLYQNIALRRYATERGDEPAAELLGQLEPILLDIAHLPNKARTRDVRPIEQRMEKKEIVAALRVRTLLASN